MLGLGLEDDRPWSSHQGQAIVLFEGRILVIDLDVDQLRNAGVGDAVSGTVVGVRPLTPSRRRGLVGSPSA